MQTEFYSLKVEKTAEGLSFVEDGNMSEFELMGILFHLQQEHSKKLSKDLADYEQERING